ncbi:response regulator transcription factor [Slackia equolifaciens]|uniref:response regulator transcription factor n=1 Tax=Slackia equolifaciens TaxID=498718 RepID=UPI00137A5F71|nr:LuxR C-terminal-related transcriptional regulator [Slackia equolifaciens]
MTLVLLCCVWTCRISSVMLRDRVLILAGGVMAGCVVYSIVALIPQPFALFVGGCLPATSIAFAFAADSADAPRGYSSQGGVSVFPFEVELASSAILFGVLFVLCGHAFPDREAQWVSAVAPGMIHVAALFVLEVIITLVMMFGSGRTNPLIAVRPSAIVVAVSLLLLPFASEIWRMGCLALAFAGFGSFMVYFVIVMGNISQERGANASQVCAWGMLLVVAGALIGEVLSVVLLAIRPIMPIDYVSALSICGLFVMVVMQWGMAKRYDLAHETREMGGHYFLDERPAEALKFQEIARHFSLSPRETEVLVMLAKGRSIPYICEALCISKSTAQTHVRHIYDKMEVSEGRQGLIDAIEQFGAQ